MAEVKKKNSKKRFIICCSAFVLILVLLIVITATGSPANSNNSKSSDGSDNSQSADEGSSEPSSANGGGSAESGGKSESKTTHMIEGVPTIQQADLKAGCETYACTMLLQSLGYDMDEFMFADNYLICAPTSWDEYGNHYGPDMYSAMAGTAYLGFGVYAPAMAKSMNNYLTAVGSKQKAYALDGVSLEQLCRDYIDHDIPVMVWATTWMWEPGTGEESLHRWIVDYVDPEIGRAQIGDEVYWKEHEHCLVLIGYDEDEYYFADSYKGAVSHFEKDLCQLRYEQIGTMAIVVK